MDWEAKQATKEELREVFQTMINEAEQAMPQKPDLSLPTLKDEIELWRSGDPATFQLDRFMFDFQKLSVGWVQILTVGSCAMIGTSVFVFLLRALL